MAWVIAFIFIVVPLGMAIFFCWRAYQLAVKGRVELAHQWLPEPAPGIEHFAKLLAYRDLIFAFGCLLFLALLLAMPQYFAVLPGVLAAFGFGHQAITYYAIHKAKKAKNA